MGKKLTLQLHHIDGNHKNNKLENLMILCPNCHSQTDSFCIPKTSKKAYEPKYCKECGKLLYSNNISGLCSKCFQKAKQMNIPSYEELKTDFETLKTFCKISKKYNVSYTTVKKWLLKYNII